MKRAYKGKARWNTFYKLYACNHGFTLFVMALRRSRRKYQGME